MQKLTVISSFQGNLFQPTNERREPNDEPGRVCKRYGRGGGHGLGRKLYSRCQVWQISLEAHLHYNHNLPDHPSERFIENKVFIFYFH